MKKYLATVAAVGLIAGLGAANAQSPGSMEKKELPGASSNPATQPSQSSPTQKQAPAQAAPKSGQTVGQAPSGTKAGAEIKSGAPGDTKAGANAETKSSASPDTKSGMNAGAKMDSKSGTSAQTDTKTDTKSGASSQTTGQAASGSINLTAQQKTEIRQKVLVSAPKVDKVDFSLNVGTVVPRTVRIVAVPETLIVIHPQWRGYRYFVVGDEIVVVEPDTLKIVAVLAV